MEVKAIVTDLDGVIFDSVKVYYDAVLFVANTLGYEITDSIIRQHLVSKKDFESFFGNDIKRAYELFVEYCQEEISGEKFELFPGIKELLTEIRQKGIQLIAYSDRTKKACDIVLSHHNLDNIYEGNVISRSCTGVSKPNPAGLNMIIDQFKLGIEDIIFVGDGFQDHGVSELVGVKFIGVNSGLNTSLDWQKKGVTNIDNFLEIINFI